MTIVSANTGKLYFIRMCLQEEVQAVGDDFVDYEETSSDLLGENGSLERSIQMSKESLKRHSTKYFDSVDGFMFGL